MDFNGNWDILSIIIEMKEKEEYKDKVEKYARSNFSFVLKQIKMVKKMMTENNEEPEEIAVQIDDIESPKEVLKWVDYMCNCPTWDEDDHKLKMRETLYYICWGDEKGRFYESDEDISYEEWLSDHPPEIENDEHFEYEYNYYEPDWV